MAQKTADLFKFSVHTVDPDATLRCTFTHCCSSKLSSSFTVVFHISGTEAKKYVERPYVSSGWMVKHNAGASDTHTQLTHTTHTHNSLCTAHRTQLHDQGHQLS